MKKRLVSLILCALMAFACQSHYSARQSPELERPPAELNLWNRYVNEELGADAIMEECRPRIMRADPHRVRRGLVMFIHGYSSCPQEFAALVERLTEEGFDVYLPLLPGHGRKAAPPALGERPDLVQSFVAKMNAIAQLATRGDKVLAGLSGGTSLAMEAALAAPQLWDRLLFYAPRMNDSLVALPRIQQPLQLVSVHYGQTDDASALHKLIQGRRNARLCFYPEGVPHAMLRAATDAHPMDGYWLPALHEDSLSFITKGRWFRTNHVTTEKEGPLTCRYAL
jgi:pimeloyl-ACP methyl ester carboxylesterase